MNDAATLANEMVGQIREEKQQHVLIRFFSSHWTLNVISIFCFFLLWDFLAAYKILGNSLARPMRLCRRSSVYATIALPDFP